MSDSRNSDNNEALSPDSERNAATEHADTLRALRESERRWSLLARLADVTRHGKEPVEIIQAAMEILRGDLQADRCTWAEVEADQDHFTFLGGATAPGISGVAGRYPVSAFGKEALRELREGNLFVCMDALTDLPEGADREAYLQTGIRALIAIPIRKGGRFIAGLGLHMLAPRRWTQEEIEIAREVAERCWESIERARVEKALRESEERYRTVVNNQIEMLCRFRADGTILFVNLSYAAARGTTPEELIGKNFWEFLPPQDVAEVRGMLACITRESPELHIENRFETSKGIRWTLWVNRGLKFDADGRVVEAQSSGIDITDRKNMEETLREADRRKDEFLAMLAHELRNPLAPIRNATQVLKLLGPADANQQWAREVIERQTQHLTRLVDDLLDVSRITRGKVTLQRESVDLSAIVHRAVEASRPLLDARRHRLSIDLAPDPLHVDGDLTRLVQVVGNLLNNAAKYTDEGGHIRISSLRDGDEARISICDDGMGIPADLLPHVFDLFTQANRSLDRSQGGLGIGLTLVRRLIEMHGGRVEAFSEGAGRGSEFVVRLPALPVTNGHQPGSGHSGASPSPNQNASFRVLVVEDNIDSAQMMAFMLRLDGYEVSVIHDGSDAHNAARAFRPSVILCDIGLPGLNGYEVAAQLRTDADLKDIRLVALTGYGQEEDRRRSRDAGFDFHLIKPVDPVVLGELLASIRKEQKETPPRP